MLNSIKIDYVKIGELREYYSNPKLHEEKQIQQIAKSIERFGFNNPILVDERSEVIAGHGRLLAARLLKLDAVPVVRLIHLSEAEKRAYRIADNKLSENGRWDTDLLKLFQALIVAVFLAVPYWKGKHFNKGKKLAATAEKKEA